jgi:hypothetical protein
LLDNVNEATWKHGGAVDVPPAREHLTARDFARAQVEDRLVGDDDRLGVEVPVEARLERPIAAEPANNVGGAYPGKQCRKYCNGRQDRNPVTPPGEEVGSGGDAVKPFVVTARAGDRRQAAGPVGG